MSWWQQLNRRFGFEEDERQQQIHGLAARNAYVVLVLGTVLVGLYQEVVLQQSHALWINLGILGTSLALLALQRVQLGGLAAADERMERIRRRLYLWPYMVLMFGILAHSIYQSDELTNARGIMPVNAAIFSGPLTIMFTHALYRTAQGRLWFWLLGALVSFGPLVFIAILIGPSIVHEYQAGVPFLSIAELMSLLFVLFPPLGCGTVFVVAAWRSWQDLHDLR